MPIMLRKKDKATSIAEAIKGPAANAGKKKKSKKKKKQEEKMVWEHTRV